MFGVWIVKTEGFAVGIIDCGVTPQAQEAGNIPSITDGHLPVMRD